MRVLFLAYYFKMNLYHVLSRFFFVVFSLFMLLMFILHWFFFIFPLSLFLSALLTMYYQNTSPIYKIYFYSQEIPIYSYKSNYLFVFFLLNVIIFGILYFAAHDWMIENLSFRRKSLANMREIIYEWMKRYSYFHA